MIENPSRDHTRWTPLFHKFRRRSLKSEIFLLPFRSKRVTWSDLKNHLLVLVNDLARLVLGD